MSTKVQNREPEGTIKSRTLNLNYRRSLNFSDVKQSSRTFHQNTKKKITRNYSFPRPVSNHENLSNLRSIPKHTLKSAALWCLWAIPLSCMRKAERWEGENIQPANRPTDRLTATKLFTTQKKNITRTPSKNAPLICSTPQRKLSKPINEARQLATRGPDTSATV